jgi:hypothetical protein
MDTRELLSIEDARHALGGIARATLYDLLNRGELASIIIGRRRFIPATAIAAFIATTATTIAPSQVHARRRHRAVQMPLAPEPSVSRRGRPGSAAPRS